MARHLLILRKTFPDHRGRPGLRGGSLPRASEAGGAGGAAPPARSADIQSLAQAEAYWREKFTPGTPVPIRCQYGLRKYALHVTFERNHAFTEARSRGGRDEDRAFDAPRAQGMDSIWEVLRQPQAVTWSTGGASRKVFDRTLALTTPGGGRVVLEPRPTPEDIENGEVTHFAFVSWHLIPRGKVDAALREARRKHVSPFALKKTLGEETPLEQIPASRVAAAGFGRGIPFDWRPYFHGDHNRTPEGAGDGAWPCAEYSLGDALLKAQSIPPGARWITVRPNGPGTDGQPVLVQPAENGAMRVIGGAGGKLNYLKLHGVRSEADYKADAGKRAREHRERAKEKRAEERASGTAPSKTKAREAVALGRRAERDSFVQAVSQAMQWSEADTRFPEEKYRNAPEADYRKAAEAHANALFQRARDAVAQQRARLLADAERRADAGLSSIPLEVPDDQPERLSVSDLDPVQKRDGLGFDPAYGKRAEEAGLSGDELAAESAAAKGKEPPAPKPAQPGQGGGGGTTAGPSAPKPKKPVGEAMGEALEETRERPPTVDPATPVDAKVAMDLLRAEKKLREANRAARQRLKEIDAATTPVEPKAFILEVEGKALDQGVVRDLEEELKTARTRGFLAAVKEAGGTEALGPSVASGAFASVNALALAAGGSSLVDRSVVDVLGPAGAAQVLAARLHKDLSPAEFDQVKEAMGRFHVDHYMRVSTDALAEAKAWHEQAAEIALGEAASGADLAVAQELNARRRELAGKSRQVMGRALGEMETNAALVAALERPDRAEVQVSLEGTAPEMAIKQARAIGLQRGEYVVERVGATTMLTVNKAGLERLAAPVSREDLAATRDALDIIDGHHDEDGWLPKGFADRPDIGMDLPEGVAPRLARAFPEAPADIAAAVRDYIGGRTADGDQPADILQSLQSNEMLERSGDREAMVAALDAIAPMTDAEGKLIRVEGHAKAFEALADDYVARRFGGTRQPIHKQQVQVDRTSVDALHRALAEHPDGVAAFKPVGELTPQDQRALRQAFLREHGQADPEAEAARKKVEALDAAQPEKERDGLFGPEITPEWTDWKKERDAAAEAANKATLSWERYGAVMGGPAAAYAAMQDVVRGRVLDTFARQHNRLRPDAPLRTGRAVIRGDLQHLDALDPGARAKREQERRDLTDALRNRTAGRYASGSVSDKMAAAREADAAVEQAQLGMFGFEDAPAPRGGDADEPLPEDTRAMGLGERVTIGHAAERQVGAMMQQVGRNFRPGQPVELWKPTMSGRFVGRQRAIKLVKKRKRIALAQGVGSGKTSMMLGAFTDLREAGEVKRGLFIVPSIVQGQFGGEALTALEPGRYNWHAAPGASREERVAAYRDPNIHFNVVTHQSFRDDMLHLAAERDGITPDEVGERFEAMGEEERANYLRDVMHHHGLDHDYVAMDEAHGALNRKGKENSSLANVIDAVGYHAPYLVSATADPVKNDASEAFDVLKKMDPRRYQDREAFLRKYGGDDPASRANLKREMARHLYPGKIDSGVRSEKKEIKVSLSDDQHAQLAALDKAAGRARLARMEGRVDLDAARALAPGAFDGVEEAHHEKVARNLQDSIGIVHNTARKHVIDGGAKLDHIERIAQERTGKKGVVFARRLERVEEIAARLKAQGKRVVTITGKDTSKDKAAKLRAYKAGEHDVVVASDAGAVGANMQAGQWLAQFDTPDTAMVHAQRNGRIDRVGQKNDVELLDLVADHPDERKARDRLGRKYELRSVLTSPMEGLDDTGLAGMLSRIRAGKADAAEPHFPALPLESAPAEEPEEQSALF